MRKIDAAKVAIADAAKISEELRLSALAEAVRNLSYGGDFPFSLWPLIERLGGKPGDIGPILLDRAARRGIRPPAEILRF